MYYSVYLTNGKVEYHHVADVVADNVKMASDIFINSNDYVKYDENSELELYENEDKAYISWGEQGEFYYTIMQNEV